MPATQSTEAEVGRIIDAEKGISGNDEFAHTPDESIPKEPPGFGAAPSGKYSVYPE